MACKKFRIFPITSFGTDGYPIVGTPVLLVAPGTDNKEFNIKSVGFSATKNTAEIEADDSSEETTAIVKETVTVEALGINPDAFVALGLAKKDSNGNLAFVQSNSTHVCLFVKGANQKGLSKNFWFYDCVAQPLDEKVVTQLKGNSADPITLTLINHPIVTTGFGSVPHAEVFEGLQGFIKDEDQVTAVSLYKGTVAP